MQLTGTDTHDATDTAIPGFALGVANRDRLRRAAEQAARLDTMPDGPDKTLAAALFAIDVATCPLFCTNDHTDTDHGPGPDVHESTSLHTGPVAHHVHVSLKRGAVLALALAGGPEYLDLDELDALLANLNLHRAMLAVADRYVPEPVTA